MIKQREAEFDDEKKLVLLKRLNNAKNINDRPIPKSLLQKFEIDNPSKSVEFVNTKSIATVDSYKYNNVSDPLTKKILETRPDNFPLFIHLNHFPSQFIELHFWSTPHLLRIPRFYHILICLMSYFPCQ